jgi:hypothetical protein
MPGFAVELDSLAKLLRQGFSPKVILMVVANPEPDGERHCTVVVPQVLDLECWRDAAEAMKELANCVLTGMQKFCPELVDERENGRADA